MSSKVEIGFNLNDPSGDFAILDDPVKGILGSPTYVLAGVIFYDVTDRVRNISISRGKSRQLDRFSAGQASVIFDNNDRLFDPLFEASPYAGQIVPRRDVRISTNDIVQYRGVIDDWNLNYAPEGNSTASLSASDGLSFLSNQVLTPGTVTSQFAGNRIRTVLNMPSVNFPAENRDLETGTQLMQFEVIPDGENALNYIELITTSESGSSFINKEGGFTFRQRNYLGDINNTPVLADDGTGIPYQTLEVVYGSELLYNEVIVSRKGGGTATSSDIDSQRDYGISTLKLDNLLFFQDIQNQELADHLIANYSQPEYRFERLGVDLTSLTQEQQDQILNLEMSDLVTIIFTPNNIPPVIEQFGEVIRIEHEITPFSHRVVLGFESAAVGYFTLSDDKFGRLTRGNILL